MHARASEKGAEHLVTIPLAALRPALAGGWPAGSRWLRVDGDGGHGSVEHPTGSALAFLLKGSSEARLRGRVSLVNAGPDNPRGIVRVRAVLCVDGRTEEVWSGFLGRVVGQLAHEVSFDAPLSGGSTELRLLASKLRPKDPGVTRVRWEGTVIEVPAEPSTPDASPPVKNRVGTPAPSSHDSLISILTPVHDPSPAILEETLSSVRAQSFQRWELRLVDDGSTDPAVIEILERAAGDDERIHLARHEKAKGISAATNTALNGARGKYIALLDHDDMLTEDALEEVAEVIANQPEVDMIYSDEDVIEEGSQLAVFRKPSWSPDLMRSHMYSCHFGVYRRALATAIGGFRSEFDGSQDYDFVLRFSERTDRIVHIPRILYHWRSHKGSVADDLAAKPHAYAAARRAIAEHLERTGVKGSVHFDAQRCWYRIDYHIDPGADVDLILPVNDADAEYMRGLDDAVHSWARTRSPSWQLVLVGPSEAIERCRESLTETLAREQLRTVSAPAESGRSALINRAVATGSASRLVLLEAPVEPLTSPWLSRLVAQAGRAEIGAVGAKTLAVDGRVERSGLVLQAGLPSSVLLAADQVEPGPMAVLQVTSNFAAVDGTIAIDRQTFERLDGFDERFDELGAVDFCLRAWRQGMWNLSSPDVVVRRTERRPPVNDLDEMRAFHARWSAEMPTDPYFDPPAATALTGLAVRG